MIRKVFVPSPILGKSADSPEQTEALLGACCPGARVALVAWPYILGENA